MALKAKFERVIDKAYHTTGNTGIMGGGTPGIMPYAVCGAKYPICGGGC